MSDKRQIMGRPLKFSSPEELKKLIQDYLDNTDIEEYTVSGLALAIGASRQLLMDYEKREGYSDLVKEAKLIVENAYELSLRKHGRSGDIFALKNFGWRDKQELDVGGGDTPVEIKSTSDMTREELMELINRKLMGN